MYERDKLERPRHRWKYNIKMFVRITDYEDMLWSEVAQIKLQWWDAVNTVKNFQVL